MPRRKRATKRNVEQGLCDLAFGDISDAVALLYLSDEEALQRLPRLNLFNVAEIKRPRGGGMEIKFFDRLKAIERLNSDLDEHQDGGFSFYDALRKGAENMREEGDNARI